MDIILTCLKWGVGAALGTGAFIVVLKLIIVILEMGGKNE